MSEPSWSDFEKQAVPAPTEDRLAEICARVFTSPDGKELLGELRRRYFEQGHNPLADERALRFFVTRQHFVRELELACERGLKANAKPK